MIGILKKYGILILILGLIVFGISLSIKCSKLERENIKLKTDHFTILDSIKTETNILLAQVETLSLDLDYYKYKVDSLKNVKQRVIIKTEYVIADNITEGVEKLKENLKWEKY